VRLVGSSEQRTLCIRAESRSARKLRRVGVCTVPPGVGETTPDNTPRAAPGATPVHEYPDTHRGLHDPTMVDAAMQSSRE
jgi:hypothetical protein